MRKQALDHFNADGSEVCVKSLVINGVNICTGIDFYFTFYILLYITLWLQCVVKLQKLGHNLISGTIYNY